MPTYQYQCTDCGNALEVRQSFTDDALTVCPACDGTRAVEVHLRLELLERLELVVRRVVVFGFVVEYDVLRRLQRRLRFLPLGNFPVDNRSPGRSMLVRSGHEPYDVLPA